MSRTFIRNLCLAALLMPAVGSAHAQDYFINSDDYRDGEEIVNVFLTEADYRLMVEDIGRNGEEFDWGWVKTAATPQTPASETTPTRRFPRIRLSRSGHRPAHPGVLGFDVAAYTTIAVTATNFAGVVPQSTTTAVRDAFVLAAGELGLKVVPEGGQLELAVGIVDLKRDSTYIYFANIDPFIELEVRLRDTATGETLMLVRNQAHSATPEDAALNFASTLVKFVR